jgi:hypothetical protein
MHLCGLHAPTSSTQWPLAGIIASHVACAVPCASAKVPMTGKRGLRTDSNNFASDEALYAVNHGAATAGMYMSIGMVLFGIVLPLLP